MAWKRKLPWKYAFCLVWTNKKKVFCLTCCVFLICSVAVHQPRCSTNWTQCSANTVSTWSTGIQVVSHYSGYGVSGSKHHELMMNNMAKSWWKTASKTDDNCEVKQCLKGYYFLHCINHAFDLCSSSCLASLLVGRTRLKFESCRAKYHTQNASQQHFCCFLNDIWILKSSCSLKSPTHDYWINDQGHSDPLLQSYIHVTFTFFVTKTIWHTHYMWSCLKKCATTDHAV